MIAPTVISTEPKIIVRVIFSLRKIPAKIMVNTRLSLSIGTTLLASPI